MIKNLAKTDNYIFWLTKIVLGVCLLTPIFVSSTLLFPYTAAKAFAFRILVEVAALFYLYLALKYPDLRPKKNIFTLAIGIFLLTWFLSAILGTDFYLSWWGSLERMLGVWGLIHFIIFFLLLVSLFRAKKDWLALFRVSLATSVLISLLALVQKFGSLGNLLPHSERVFGTIGNPAFLAGYLIFNLFFSVYLFWSDAAGKNWRKGVYALAFLLQLVVIFLTGTRGALVGVFSGLMFYLFLFGFFWPNKIQRKYFFIAAGLIIFLVGSIFLLRNTSFLKNSETLSRVASISLSDTTVQNRFILWQKAWQAWQEKPIFGWGPENYSVAINKFFDVRLAPYEAWYDRAHNFIFDYGVATGWLGLLAYIFLLGLAGFFLWKISLKEFHLAVIFGALMLAYLVQNFFVFDTFSVFLMLFFALAIIYFFYYNNETAQPAGYNLKPVNAGKKIVLAVLAIVIVFLLYSFSLKPILASYYGNRAVVLGSGNFAKMDNLLEKSLALDTFASPEIVYQAALNYLIYIQNSPALAQNENFYKISSGGLSEAIRQNPNQAKYYIVSAWLNLYFSGGQAERLDAAIGQAKKAQELSPAKKDSYLVLVAAYFFKKDQAAAQAQIAQASKISPALGEEVKNYAQKLSNK